MELKNYFAQDKAGNVIPFASVTLYLKGSQTLASDVKNADDTPKENPFKADANGLIQFAAPDGYYDLKVATAVMNYSISIQLLDLSVARDATQQAAANAQDSELSAADSAAEALRLKNQASEIVLGDMPSLTVKPNKVPLANPDGFIDEGWLESSERNNKVADEVENLRKVSSDYLHVGSFDNGGTVRERNEVVALGVGTSKKYYQWLGELPKSVAASSTPSSTGGVNKSAWKVIPHLSLREELESWKLHTINVKQFGIFSGADDHTTLLMQAVADNPTYTTFYFEDGTYNFAGFLLEKDGIKLIGQSKKGTVFNVSAGSSGVSFRCGKRGPMSDTRGDNLPVYDGTIDYLDLNHFSPEVVGYPRYKDIRVDNVTINLIGDQSTGFDFYRVDGGGYDINLTFEGAPVIGNAIRTFFCTYLWIPELDTQDNKNSTYNTFFYWCYGIRGKRWDIGAGTINGLEFKHGVDCKVDDVTCYGDTTNRALNIGYGSRNVEFESLRAVGGSVRYKASEEFDLSHGLRIKRLVIDNPEGGGLQLSNVGGVEVESYYIKASAPLNINYQDFYMFSSDTSVAPSKSTKGFVYDGNYDVTELSGSYTKYFENRNAPSLIDSKFGKGTLHNTGMGVYRTVYIGNQGGLVETFGPDGKAVRATPTLTRGFEESKRCTHRYNNDLPRVIKNVDFGDMEIIEEHPMAKQPPLTLVNPLDGCKGQFTIRNGQGGLAEIFLLFDSDLEINSDTKPSSLSIYPIILHTMVNSTLKGTIKCAGKVCLFDSGGTVYADGFLNHKISMNFIYDGYPGSAPPFFTDLGTPEKWRGPLDLSGMKIYRDDGEDVNNTLSRIIQHISSVPTDTDNNGGGIYHQGATFDGKHPFCRVIDAAPGTVPTNKPNFVGELARNIRIGVDEWFTANNMTQWRPM